MKKKSMKRGLGILLSSCLLLSLVGCKTEKNADNSASEAKTAKATATSTSDTSYEDALFDSSYVHSINIEISEDDWKDLLANPLNKTKYNVSITIDDETIENVSFATKGNTSLSSVASDSNSNRFEKSFGRKRSGCG